MLKTLKNVIMRYIFINVSTTFSIIRINKSVMYHSMKYKMFLCNLNTIICRELIKKFMLYIIYRKSYKLN